MNKVFVFAAVMAGLGASSAAQADLFSQVNSFSTVNRWYAGPTDYPGTTITTPNGGLPSLRFQESNYIPFTGFATRNVGFLAVGGVPIQFDGFQSFRVDTFVTINSTGGSATEAGFMIGTAPNLPSSAGADTGDFHIRLPDGEIAAFGSQNPFFANNNPFNGGNAHPWPTIASNTTYQMTFIYNTSAFGSSMNFGVNGVFTGDLAMGDPRLHSGALIGVFAQGPNNNGVTAGSYSKDVIFTNTTITVPAPAAASLLGLGGLLAARRRRR